MWNFKKLLEEWGVVEYYQKFIDECITDESFCLLDEETLKIIFPKRGPFLLFKDKYNKYLTSLNKEVPKSDNSDETLSVQSLSSESSGCSSSYNELVVLEPDDDLQELLNPRQNSSHTLDSEGFLIPSPAKQKKYSSVFENYSSLEDLLQKSGPEGKSLLHKKHRLSGELRQKLVNIVVGELMCEIFNKETIIEIKPETFINVTKEILSVFPNETRDVYYIPYTSGRGGLRRHPARGKLWSRYLNIRAQLRLLKSDNSHKTREFHTQPELTDHESDSVEFLKSNIEPFVKILSNWENTYNFRQYTYKDESIDKLFKDFPCLLKDTALLLFECDFNRKYEDKIDVIYNQWPKVARAVLKESEERSVKTPHLRPDLDVELQALLSLSYLCSPVNIKKGKELWRPTRCEVQDSIFFMIDDFVDLNAKVEGRKTHLDKLEYPVQPFGFCINGEYFIWAYEQIYKIDNHTSIRCLELLYKMYHALNLEYPAESKHIWLFIQELVFSMAAPSKLSITAQAVSDIKFHLI